jgi:hypothetical protein
MCLVLSNTTLDDQVIFVSVFFRPAALQMLIVALATPALCALQVKKIKFAKISPFHPEGSIEKKTKR